MQRRHQTCMPRKLIKLMCSLVKSIVPVYVCVLYKLTNGQSFWHVDIQTDKETDMFNIKHLLSHPKRDICISFWLISLSKAILTLEMMLNLYIIICQYFWGSLRVEHVLGIMLNDIILSLSILLSLTGTVDRWCYLYH